MASGSVRSPRSTSSRAASPAPARSRARGADPARPAAPPSSSLAVAPPAWLVASGPDQHERRRRPRARAEFQARLYGGDGRESYLEARLRSADVSVSGVFLRSTFFLPLGAAVRVEFEVPGIGTVLAAGRVARVQDSGEPTGFAIEFEAFGEGSLEALVSVFVADEVRGFVEQYCQRRRGERDVPTPTSLLHGILAWEIYRSTQRGSDGT